MEKLLLPISLAALLALATSAFGASGNFTNTSGGTWNTAGNWTPAAVPGTAAGDAVKLNADFTAGAKTITLDTNAIVGTMVFGDGNATSPSALTLNGTSTLTFNNSGANATLTFQGSTSAGGGTINAPILLADHLAISGGSAFYPVIGGTISAGTAGLKTITYSTGGTTFGGVISDGAGSVAITQTGSGTLTLNGNNSFSGGVTFTRGTLTLGDARALGNGTLTLTNVASITLTATAGLSFSNNMTLAGANIGGGAGNITWAGNVTQSAASTINRVGRTDISGNVYLSANSTSGNTLTLGGSSQGNGTISGVISNYNGAGGTAGTINVANGTWTLSKTNAYNGSTVINGGKLVYGINQAISADNSISINAKAGAASATLDLAGFSGTANKSISFGGSTATTNGTNELSTGAGTLTLNSSTAFIYYTTGVNPGTATVSGNLDLGTMNHLLTVGDSAATLNELNITANITASGGAYGFNKGSGAGTLTLSGANTYAGATNVDDGILSVGSLNSVSGISHAGSSNLGAPTTVSNGTIGVGSTTTTGQLTYTGSGETTDRVIKLSGTTGGAVLDQSGASGLLKFTSNFTATGAGAKTLTLQGSTSGTGEIAGTIVNYNSANATSVTKSGSGTWVLSGTNTYSGSTNVTAGTLLVNGNQTAANGAVAVASGATLGGNGTLGGATAVTGIVSPGTTGVDTLNIANSVTWNGAATAGSATDWIFQLGAANTADLLNITGAFTKGSGSVFRFDFAGTGSTGTFKLVDWTTSSSFSASEFSFTNLASGLTGSFTMNGTQLEFNALGAVPEPSTWIAMAALSLAGATILLRRKVHP